MAEIKFLKTSGGRVANHDPTNDSAQIKSLGVGTASPTAGLALAASTPTASGQIGMGADGRPVIYVGGVAQPVAHTADGVTAIQVTQNGHGFSTGNAVYYTGSAWAKAKADSATTLGIGIVVVIDSATFTVYFAGQITGLSGLTAGQYYFVSDATAGAITTTEPTATTSYSNPILFALSATAGILPPYRPSQVGPVQGNSAYTTTTAQFTQPAVNSNVQISVTNALWMVAAQVIYVAGGGYYSVVSVDSGTLATIQNLGYPGNLAPGQSVPNGSGVSPAGVRGAAGQGGGNAWSTLYDVDFTAQANQTFNQPTVTIDGKTWTVTQNANLGGSIVNGTGMVLTPVVQSNVNSGLMIKLSDLVGSFDGTALRVRARMSRSGGINGFSTNYSLMVLQWDGNMSFSNNLRTAFGHESENNSLRVEYFPYGSDWQTNAQTNDNTDDVMMMVYTGGTTNSLYSGVYSAGWPAQSAMRRRGIDAGLAPMFSYNPPTALVDAAIGFFMYNGAAPSFTETITRLMIEGM